MLLFIASVLFVLWLAGFLLRAGGGFIHLLLIVALIVAIVHFFRS